MTATTLPRIGDRVLCDGRMHIVTDRQKRYARDTDEFLYAVQFEDPQLRTFALERELRWSTELDAWYLWGRCLSPDDQQAVIELRDRGLLVARTTRTPTNAPAGGEHLDLYLALVQDKPKGFLAQQLAPLRRGEPPAPALRAAAEAFAARWRGPHSDGYAEPDEPPSSDIASQPAGRS
jgi:hypothetical protein